MNGEFDPVLTAVRLSIAALSEAKSPQPHWVRAGNCVLWLCALDEILWPEPSYKSRRDADAHGRVLDGLRFARDRVAHGAQIVASARGMEYQSLGELGTRNYGPIVWVPLNRLVVPPERITATLLAQSQVYAERVASRLVAEPLDDALDWFDRMQVNGWRAPVPLHG